MICIGLEFCRLVKHLAAARSMRCQQKSVKMASDRQNSELTCIHINQLNKYMQHWRQDVLVLQYNKFINITVNGKILMKELLLFTPGTLDRCHNYTYCKTC